MRPASRRVRCRTRSTIGPGWRTRRASGSCGSRTSSAGVRTAPHARSRRRARTRAGSSSRGPRGRLRSRAFSPSSSRASSPSCPRARSRSPSSSRPTSRARSRCTGAGGRSTGSTVCSCSTSERTTRASRRSPSSDSRPWSSADHSTIAHSAPSGTTSMQPSSSWCAISPLSGTSGSHASPAWSASCTARRAREAFEEAARDLGLSARVVPTDYPPESGARATRELLTDPEPPTAIAFDSDVLAVAGAGAAQQMGVSVPDELSIVAWDDSLLCQVVHPPDHHAHTRHRGVRSARNAPAPRPDRRPRGRRSRGAARSADAPRQHRHVPPARRSGR